MLKTGDTVMHILLALPSTTSEESVTQALGRSAVQSACAGQMGETWTSGLP